MTRVNTLPSEGDKNEWLWEKTGCKLRPAKTVDCHQIRGFQDERHKKLNTGSVWFFLKVREVGTQETIGRQMSTTPLRSRESPRRRTQDCFRHRDSNAAAEQPDQGKVIAVGAGRVLKDGTVRSLDVKVGERVLFGKHAGQAVKVHDEEVFVMREEEILAVLEN